MPQTAPGIKNIMTSHRFFAKTSLLALALLCAASTSWAALVTWVLNPSNLNADVGSPTRSYTVSGFNIVASGYDHLAGGDRLHQLHYKSEPPEGGAMEIGLGLQNTNANELNLMPDGTPEHYIQLDLRSILALGFVNGKIQVASMQVGEGFRLFGSNSAGVLGLQLPGTWTGLAFDNQFVSVPNFGAFQFISVAANSGRVLPVAFQAEINPIPEMSAFYPIIGLVAAVSVAQVIRRRRAALL